MQPFSDEDASIESLSHCSSFSDAISVADEGNFAVYTCVAQRHVPVFELVSGCVRMYWLCCKWVVFCVCFFFSYLSVCRQSSIVGSHSSGEC